MLKAVKNTKRLSEIVLTFARHGFSSWIEQTRLFEYLSATKQFLTKKEVKGKSAAERFRGALEELGPTFVKLGQILSTRNDLLPEDWVEEFSNLQDDVHAHPIEGIETYLEKELGRPLDEVFNEFEKKPFAAASIAQVHGARLKDGTSVVVKVQRAGVEENVETDLSLIAYLAELAERHIEAARDLNVQAVAREFSRQLRRELDYRIEKRNILRFRENFKGNPAIHIPEVFSEFCTRRCLVMEKVSGVKVSELQADEETRRELARNGAQAILQMIFMDGLFHGDPHPGNIFILEENIIGFIDFGMVGRADRETRKLLVRMLGSIAQKDATRTARTLLLAGKSAAEVDMREMTADIEDIIDRYYGETIKNVQLSDVVNEILALVRRHRIKLPVEYSMILKTLLTLEKVVGKLDENFDLNKEIEPFVKKMFLQKFSIGENLSRAWGVLEEFGELLREFPLRARDIMRKLHEGRLSLEFRHANIDKLVDELSRASSRIAFALVILALAIASSVMVALGREDVPRWLGYAGYIIAGVLGTTLLVSLLFRRRF